MPGIYKIRCIENGKEYIGSTKNKLEDRKADHWTTMRRGVHKNRSMQAAWNKYGECSFEWQVILECTEDELLFEEDRLMREHNTMAPNGFNLKEAERQVMCEDTKRKMSESKKGEKNSFWGKRHSEETVAKIKEKCKQLRHTDEMKELLRQKMDMSTWSEEKARSYKEKQRAAHELRTVEEKEAIRQKAKKTIDARTPEETEAIRQKMSDSAKGRAQTEEAKKKISEKKRGVSHTEEAKERMRTAARARVARQKERRKELEALGLYVKKTYSEERKQAAREGLLRRNEEKRRATEAALVTIEDSHSSDVATNLNPVETA